MEGKEARADGQRFADGPVRILVVGVDAAQCGQRQIDAPQLERSLACDRTVGDRTQQGERLAITRLAAGAVAEVGGRRPALDVGDTMVAARQFEPEPIVARGIGAETLEIGERVGHDHLAHGRRAWQRLHRVVHLEDQGAGELTRIAEPPLGPIAIAPRRANLPEGHAQRDDQGEERHRRCDDRGAMPAREPRQHVGHRHPARFNRLSRTVTGEVVRDLLGRCVAIRRGGRHRLFDDRVKIAPERARRIRAPGIDSGDRARRRRVGIRHQRHNLAERSLTRLVWTAARQHLVHHHADRVDVGGGGHRLATELLGARVVRGERARRARHRRITAADDRVVEQLRDAEVEHLDHAVRR